MKTKGRNNNGILIIANKAKEKNKNISFQEQKQIICMGAKMIKKDECLQYLINEFQKIDANSKV